MIRSSILIAHVMPEKLIQKVPFYKFDFISGEAKIHLITSKYFGEKIQADRKLISKNLIGLKQLFLSDLIGS